jgi:quercetin dioxygenase-like cupin family protein
MLSRIFLTKGSVVPRHNHHNEQISYVLEGSLVFWLGRKQVFVKAGEVLLIPPNMPHKVKALEDTLSLDIFDPSRADWINKTDVYLRKSV